MLANELSDKELMMFEKLGFSYLFELGSIGVPALYRMAVEKAFLGNAVGPEVESLRRTALAMNKCTPLRMTVAFDNLITLQ